MTFQEMREVAKVGGLVRWTQSGVVEKLYLSRRRNLRAMNLISRRHHLLLRIPNYECTEVRKDELVRVGDLLPIWRPRIGYSRSIEREIVLRKLGVGLH